LGTSTHVNGDHTLNRMRNVIAGVKGMRVFLCNIYVVEDGWVVRGGDDTVFRELGLIMEIVHDPLRGQWGDNVQSLECLDIGKNLGSVCRNNDKSPGTKFPLED